MGAAVISMQGVTRVFETAAGLVRGVSDISLEVERGEMACVIGPAGSGKTTLVSMLALLDRPTLGTYRLEGLDTATLSDADCAHLRATRLGLLSARVGLLPHETVVQNVALPLAYGGVARAERLRLAEEALLAVGLPPACFDVRAEELAQSQRCRVAIARAAASKPSVVLADEPTRGLGREDEEMVLEALVRLCDAGATVVVATCDEEVAVRCDRRVRLSGDGRLAGRVPLASGEGAGERGSS